MIWGKAFHPERVGVGRLNIRALLQTESRMIHTCVSVTVATAMPMQTTRTDATIL